MTRTKMRTKKRTKMWILGVLVVGGVGAAVIVHGAEGRAAAGKPALARPGAEVVAPGTVESVSERIDLSFEQPGRVAAVLVAEGDRVTAGQVIMRLDDRLARARVARAEAQLASAEARRDIALRGARPEEIRAARAEAAGALATAHERGLARDRSTKLLADSAVSAAETDAVTAAAQAAGGQAGAAEARLELAVRGARWEVKREAIAMVAAAAAELEEARTLLAQTELKAPRAGTVLRRLVEPGEAVVMMPPTVVMALADVDDVQLRAEIDESDVARVKVGQRGYATAEAFGERRIAGRVARLTHELGRKKIVTDDPRARIDTRVLEVLFVPEAGHAPLPLGLRLDVHLEESGTAVAQN